MEFGMGTASRAHATPPCSVASLRWGRVLRGHQDPQPGPTSADPAPMSLVLTAARPAGPGVQPTAPWGPGLLLGRNLWLPWGCTHPDCPSSLSGALALDPPSLMTSPRPRPGWPLRLPPPSHGAPQTLWLLALSDPSEDAAGPGGGCGSSRGLPSRLCSRGLRAQTCGPQAPPLPGRPGALLCLGPGGVLFTGGRFARGGGPWGRGCFYLPLASPRAAGVCPDSSGRAGAPETLQAPGQPRVHSREVQAQTGPSIRPFAVLVFLGHMPPASPVG